MKIIMVSQRIYVPEGRQETWDCLDQSLSLFMLEVGLLCVALPNAFSEAALALWLDALEPSGLILSGGGDVEMDHARYNTEIQALSYAKDMGIPVLGICRGMQMLGVTEGASLVKVHGHVGTRHALNSLTYEDVNSFHACALATCPDTYDVISEGSDGVIESIRHKQLPWLGLMWHPERETPFNPNDVRTIRSLFFSPTSSEA